MIDINTPLFKAYFDIIKEIIPCYEGEEPDDVKHKLYAVISDPVIAETSTKNSTDVKATIQIAVHSWEYKYNSSASGLNNAVNNILADIKPTSLSVLDLSASGLQMMNLSVQQDRTERFGEMGGKNYISRILIFKQDIFVTS